MVSVGTGRVLNFLVSIVGGVVCHYIIKWLDRNNDDN